MEVTQQAPYLSHTHSRPESSYRRPCVHPRGDTHSTLAPPPHRHTNVYTASLTAHANTQIYVLTHTYMHTHVTAVDANTQRCAFAKTLGGFPRRNHLSGRSEAPLSPRFAGAEPIHPTPQHCCISCRRGCICLRFLSPMRSLSPSRQGWSLLCLSLGPQT